MILLPFFIASPMKRTADPEVNYLSINVTPTHPFSRGSVHISSNDPLARPHIDLAMFEDNEVDLEIVVQAIKLARKIVASKHLESAAPREICPGADAKTDEEIKEAIRNTCSTTFHPVRTLAMLPRAERGVVDAACKVYGTTNLRVVSTKVPFVMWVLSNASVPRLMRQLFLFS